MQEENIQAAILLLVFNLGAVLSRSTATNGGITLRYTESTNKNDDTSSQSAATTASTTDVLPATSSSQEEVDQWVRIKAESQSESRRLLQKKA